MGTAGTSGLLSLTGTTDNGIITLNGSAPNGTVESNLTFDGSILTVKGRIIASGSTTTDLFRITQTGTGNAFVVEDSSNTDITPFVIDGNGDVGVGISSNSSYKIYASGVSTGIRGDGSIQGVYGVGSIDNGTVYGVYGLAGDAGNPFVSSIYVGGKFIGQGGSGTNYSLQLQDGTEGVNKVLVSQTADGKSNWSSSLTGLTSVTTTTLNATQSTILGSTSTDLVSITQLGTGNAFVVKDAPNDTSNFVIDQSGNVVIGATATNYKLDVTGDTRLAGNIYGTNSNNTIVSDALIQAGLLFLSNNC
jgi:hypothetical protein